MPSFDITTTKHVVHMTSGSDQGCPHCPGEAPPSKDWRAAVEHCIQRHGYRLLHVGTETTTAADGSLRHATVAVLGGDTLEAVVGTEEFNIMKTRHDAV
jgi:hypothetical protein